VWEFHVYSYLDVSDLDLSCSLFINNNNNTNVNVYDAVIMAEPLRELSGSFDECRMVPTGRRPSY